MDTCHHENKSRAVARKPCEAVLISMCKASGELHTEDIAIDRENSHFRRSHSNLIPPHQRSPTNIGISLISPETIDRGLHLAADSRPICTSLSILTQSCLKSRASTLNDSTRKIAFNEKWRHKVIRGHLFQCRWKAIGGLHTQA